MQNTDRRLLSLYHALSFIGATLLLGGCSAGSNPSSTLGETSQAFGSFTTRVNGTVQPPVLSASKGATVYGVAGASFTEIIQGISDPTVGISPAVGKIAFIRNNNLALMDSNGTNARFLTSTYDPEGHPAWSPDGKVIAYEFQNGINLINADGTGVVRLVANGSTPRWSPNGKKIVFSRGINLTPKIHVMNVDGTSIVQLTTGTDSDTTPNWSPDGSQIAFTRGTAVWIMSADGTGIKKLFDAGSLSAYPTWQPDGKKITYISGRDMYSVNPDGTGSVNITNTFSVLDGYPSYTSNNQTIYFGADTAFLVSSIFQMTSAGANQKNITTDSREQNRDPSISPVTGTPPPPTLTSVKLIGTSGKFGTACAGFLFGQIDRAVTSVVTFDTTTNTVAGRSAGRITPLTAPETNAQNLIFSITAGDGSLSSFKYTNGASSVVTVLPGLTSSAVGVIITFSANDGGVSTVLPYTATKAVGKAMEVSQSGDIVTLQGTFTGIWNGVGNNIAQQGAKRVRINTKTGEVLGFER